METETEIGMVCPTCGFDSKVVHKITHLKSAVRKRRCLDKKCKQEFETVELGLEGNWFICKEHGIKMLVNKTFTKAGAVRRQYKCPKCINKCWTEEKVRETQEKPEKTPKKLF